MRFPSSKTSRWVLAALLAVFVFLPATTSAVSWIPVVPCGSTDADLCTPCDLFQTGKNIIDLVLFGITGPIAAFMVVLAGGMMLLGGGNPTMFSRGKTYLWNTLIGVTIILVSWTATNFIIKGLGGGTGSDSWYQFSCPAGLAAIGAIDTQFPEGGPLPEQPVPTPIVEAPALVGVDCPDTSLPLCGTAQELNVSCKPCSNVRSIFGQDLFQKYARGFISPQLLESIMVNESSCARNLESPAGAYGPMQLLPSTANLYRETCGVYKQDANGNRVEERINGGWLMSEDHWDEGVCLAAAYLESLLSTCGPDNRHLAANYNGREACAISRACTGSTSCGGGPMRRWECLWENTQHTRCNADRAGGGYRETRGYAPKVAACAATLR